MYDNKGMEDDMLTLEGMSDHMPRIGGYSGVRIREFDDGNVNPEPVKRDDEETDNLWEEFLSPNKLKSLSGVSNLEDITCLEMQVNTNEQSLGNFGAMLPNLVQLKLSNSVISTVRDLGTSLGNLKILWMSQCGLTDLDGISSLSSLVELFVAFNDIGDVSPVSMLENLEVLDLEGNLIDDLSQVEFLSLCSSLKSLNLEGNPVCVAPHANSSAEVRIHVLICHVFSGQSLKYYHHIILCLLRFLEEDHKLPTSADTESSQSEGDTPFSSPRKTEAADSISSASPTIPRPEMSPSPPPPNEHHHKRPSPLGRSLPTAPLVGRDLQRPHTSGEFRIRRYRQTSTEEKVERLLKNKLDLDVNENQSISTVVPRTPPSVQLW
ncbi:serine/threonine-protein kinase 11-interacting protein-like [Actinia tenebrosa]|uniref:Serine/threonine-protein kinase 11-interacting protein-like n=1 Tax=Actinia tenebrosa TaxID=6105 RepID=A0A6P8HIZ4_ACTTE|nr:serine/threonine-protein kinase 11-interacting protein-like [Actinia tenebrosa]